MDEFQRMFHIAIITSEIIGRKAFGRFITLGVSK
jgi:hypothetical protein